MSQSKIGSFVEVCFGTAVGLMVSLGTQLILNYSYGVEMSNGTAVMYTFWFTLVSIIRSYIIRRLWNCKFWVKLPIFRKVFSRVQ